MLSFLNGIPAKLKVLSDRLSSTWAAKLDTLHSVLSSRGVYLDNLNISEPVMGASALDSIALNSDPVITPPISLLREIYNVSGGTVNFYTSKTLTTITPSNVTTEQTLYSYTGSGTVSQLLVNLSPTTAYSAVYRLYIDGVLVLTSSSTSHPSGVVNYIIILGEFISSTCLPISKAVPFRSSIVLTVQKSTAGVPFPPNTIIGKLDITG